MCQNSADQTVVRQNGPMRHKKVFSNKRKNSKHFRKVVFWSGEKY